MLGHIGYSPALHVRRSEMTALRNLPEAAKDRLFPIIAARPWPNSKHLTRCWEKMAEAFGERRFALDLDLAWFAPPKHQPAHDEFRELYSPDQGYSAYYNKVRELQGAVPILRQHPNADPQLEEQLRQLREIDRGVLIRVGRRFGENDILVAARALGEVEDAAIFLDAGWSMDLLQSEAWASGLIRRFNEIRPDIEIVVAGSSFPEDFSRVAERGEFPQVERRLYEGLVRRHNAATLVFGDWGSTRPPRPSTPMKGVARIDLPISRSWLAFRQVNGENYSQIASRLKRDANWEAVPEGWGKYTIDCTSQSIPGGIKDPNTAAAVRINIHLHRQAYFGEAGIASDADEPYID